MSWKARLFAALLAAVPSLSMPVAALAESWQSDMLPTDRILMPAGPAKGVAFLMSDAAGWGGREAETAKRLTAQGIAVVGIDMPAYVRRINAQAPITQKQDPYDPVCAYLVSDIEGLSQQVQRASGSNDYVTPVVAGFGQGGGLALDILTQTPDVTIGGTVAVDPASAVPISNDLCTPAGYLTDSRGEIYQLPSGKLQDPATILLTPGADPDVRQRMAALQAAARGVSVEQAAEVTPAVMAKAIADRIEAIRAATAALPVTVLNVKPSEDAMAIVVSGDGGWRDIDESIGRMMQKQGIPVVGLDSLRFFWSKRTPDEVAQALDTLIKHYHDLWGVNNVMLVGYSFGADVLPAAFNRLPEATKHRVKLISLLGLSTAADWTITVDGWLGTHSSQATPTEPELVHMPLGKVQCVFGAEEEDSGCPALGKLGGAAVKVPGGHHFNDDYKSVEALILKAYAKRTQQLAATEAKP